MLAHGSGSRWEHGCSLCPLCGDDVGQPKALGGPLPQRPELRMWISSHMSDGMQRWSWLLPSSGCFAQSPKVSVLWGGESSCACRRVNGAPGMDLRM